MLTDTRGLLSSGIRQFLRGGDQPGGHIQESCRHPGNISKEAQQQEKRLVKLAMIRLLTKMLPEIFLR
jgi:hypothetical protein